MLGRLAFLTYGLACYVVFLATFLYAIAFVGVIGVAPATAYILLAIQFEERDLVRVHARLYQKYRQRVSMLLPLPPRPRVAAHHGARAAAPSSVINAR